MAFEDDNGNGQREPEERFMAGVTLRLPAHRALGRHVLGVAMQNAVATTRQPAIGRGVLNSSLIRRARSMRAAARRVAG